MRALIARFRSAGASAKLVAAAYQRATNEDGLAVVEFALLLPVMIVLFFGVIEVSMALACRADVTNVASTAADLVAQESTIATADMSNVWSAASAILYPYDTSVALITISSINYDPSTQSLVAGKVAWSCSKNGTARTIGTTVALPSGLMTASGSVIMSEITYNYTSPTTQIITGTKVMTNTFYTKPRRVAQITGPSTCP
jgi:Flp pilus assembly protein TadG